MKAAYFGAPRMGYIASFWTTSIDRRLAALSPGKQEVLQSRIVRIAAIYVHPLLNFD